MLELIESQENNSSIEGRPCQKRNQRVLRAVSGRWEACNNDTLNESKVYQTASILIEKWYLLGR